MGKIKLITVERGSKLNREEVQKALAEVFKNSDTRFVVHPIPKPMAKKSSRKKAA